MGCALPFGQAKAWQVFEAECWRGGPKCWRWSTPGVEYREGSGLLASAAPAEGWGFLVRAKRAEGWGFVTGTADWGGCEV